MFPVGNNDDVWAQYFVRFPQLSLTFLDFLWLWSFCTNDKQSFSSIRILEKPQKSLFNHYQMWTKPSVSSISVKTCWKSDNHKYKRNSCKIMDREILRKLWAFKKNDVLLYLSGSEHATLCWDQSEISVKRKTMLKDCTSTIVLSLRHSAAK